MRKEKKKARKAAKKLLKSPLMKSAITDLQTVMAARSQRAGLARAIDTLVANREGAFKERLRRMGGR